MAKKPLKYILPIRLRGDKKRIARRAILLMQHTKNLLYILHNELYKEYKKHYTISEINKLVNGKTTINSTNTKITNIIDQLNQIYKEHGSDFFQNVLKQVEQEYKSYFALLRKYKNGELEDKPSPPKPKKLKKATNGNIILVHRQFKKIDDNTYLIKISKSKDLQFIISFKKMDYINEENIKTFGIRLSLTDLYLDIYHLVEYENIALNPNHRMGIDLGIDVFAAIVTNVKELKFFNISGKELKAFNQWANKEISKLQSQIDTTNDEKIKNELIIKKRKLFSYRSRRIKSTFHMITSKIIDICIRYGISTIYIGELTTAKQNVNLGKKNNQTFYDIPFSTFIQQLTYKGQKYGIKVKVVKEYNTSKTSVLTDNVYERHVYRKLSRGLFYDPAINKIWHADSNGAANILRFNFKDAFKHLSQKELLNRLANPIKFKLTEITQNTIDYIIQKVSLESGTNDSTR